MANTRKRIILNILLFISISLVWSLCFWILGSKTYRPDKSLYFYIGLWGPVIATIVCLRIFPDDYSFKDFCKRICKLRIDYPLYLKSILTLVGFLVLSYIIANRFKEFVPKSEIARNIVVHLIPDMIIIFIFVVLPLELSFRGYLWVQIDRYVVSPLKTSFIVGLFLGIYYLPTFYIYGMEQKHMAEQIKYYPAIFFVLILSISIIIGYFYATSGKSLFLVNVIQTINLLVIQIIYNMSRVVFPELSDYPPERFCQLEFLYNGYVMLCALWALYLIFKTKGSLSDEKFIKE